MTKTDGLVAHPMRYHPGWYVEVPTGATYVDDYGDDRVVTHSFKLWRPAGSRLTWQASWDDEDGGRGDCQQGQSADDAMQLAFASYHLDVADVPSVKAAFRKAVQIGDREPQPSDGPDYHADHAAWEERQRDRGSNGTS